MKKKLYVAYGSNLNMSQMRYRCTGAMFVGSGEIVDHRLSFKGSPTSAVATVEAAAGMTVPVGVWKITPPDEIALDIYEGYPRLYQKETVPVHLASGRTVKAMIYVIDPKLLHGVPSAHYYQTLREGYMDCGLEIKFLNEAVAFSSEMYAKEIEMNGFTDCGFWNRQRSLDDDFAICGRELGESVLPEEEDDEEPGENELFDDTDGIRFRFNGM
ncbi:MAG: gamma-glutamylcyclotransferase [Clostridiales Family XIII bacterium]|jgi:hypothetical protein|nr:gamma-glutamylcyclotransferase [Clostridiales Family XIII bacterium]